MSHYYLLSFRVLSFVLIVTAKDLACIKKIDRIMKNDMSSVKTCFNLNSLSCLNAFKSKSDIKSCFIAQNHWNVILLFPIKIFLMLSLSATYYLIVFVIQWDLWFNCLWLYNHCKLTWQGVDFWKCYLIAFYSWVVLINGIQLLRLNLQFLFVSVF